MEDSFNIELVAGSIKNHLNSKNGVPSGDLFKVPRHMIHVLPGYNVRELRSPSYQQRIRDIADSIKRNGWLVTEPISGFVAREEGVDKFYLIKGHTRLLAYDLAITEGHTPVDIPSIAQPRGTGMRELNNDLVISNSGSQLALIEIGTVCQRKLRTEGLSIKEVAEDLGLKPKQVEDAISLRTSPHGVQELVIMEKVSATTALDALRKYGSGALSVLNAGIAKAESQGKKKATAKHFNAPSWNRKVVEKSLSHFRAVQREQGISEDQILPEDPTKALAFLMEKVYPGHILKLQ